MSNLKESLQQLNRKFHTNQLVKERNRKRAESKKIADVAKQWIKDRKDAIADEIEDLEASLRSIASNGCNYLEFEVNEWYYHDYNTDPIYKAYVKFAKDHELKITIKEHISFEDRKRHWYVKFEW